jgi:hypothetical protein
MIPIRKVELLNNNVKTTFQEESADSKEDSPAQPDFGEYTYNSIIGTIFRN